MQTRKSRLAAGVVVSIALTSAAWANWPQYRGPNGAGISAEKMVSSWPSDGPKVLWKKSVGPGLGSFAVKDGRAYFLAADGNSEFCHAIDAKTGEPVWTSPTPIGPTQNRQGGQGGPGPGSTPAVDNGKVYVYGSRLMFACLNASDGQIIWKHDIQREFAGQAESERAIKTWGNTTSPILVGDLVIIQGGGSGQTFLAFNKTTGDVVWKKETDKLTQSSPTLATIEGVPQIIFLVQSGLVSLDPKTGDLLWKQPYQSATAIGASPVVEGNIVYCSIGYGVGAGAYEVTKSADGKFTSKELWRTRGQNQNQWSTPVIKDGHVYHLAGGRGGVTLQCLDLKTGQTKWTGPSTGQGEVMLVDGKLIVQCAQGKLLLVDPSPEAYKEISSAEPLTGQAWGWPAFSDGVFIYRTNREAAALDMSTQ